MRKLFLSVMIAVAATSCAQTKESVSILGDSYSTFEGFVTPSTNEMWYYEETRDQTDVDDVTQTWWWKVINEGGYKLCHGGGRLSTREVTSYVKTTHGAVPL